VEISGNKSVSEDVIRREIAYAPGDLYRLSLVQDTQRRLYAMELFQFATVVPVNQEQQPAEVSTRVTVAEGKHQRVRFGVGYGNRGKSACRCGVSPSQFSWRCAVGGPARAVVPRSTAACGRTSTSRTYSSRIFH